MYEKLSSGELDALKEVANVGAGQAATALSKMVNLPVSMDIPVTKFVPVTEFVSQIGSPEEQMIGIYLKTQGEIVGETLFLFPSDGGKKLVDMVMMLEPGTTKIIGEIEESALKEISNVFSGAYIAALADLLDVNILPGLPHIAYDMAQSLFDGMLSQVAEIADEVLYVKTEIEVEGKPIGGKFLFFFDVKSIEKTIGALRNKYGEESVK